MPDSRLYDICDLKKAFENKEEAALLQQHVQEIVTGAAFRRSQRSAEFLKYILEQAVAGNLDALKERVIGVELFGRNPSYNTGEDAIVRVTASDVRKRLLQHYGRYGSGAPFKISLTPGSYIPRVERRYEDIHADAAIGEAGPELLKGRDTHAERAAPENGSGAELEPWFKRHAGRALLLSVAILIIAVGVSAWAVFWSRGQRSSDTDASILPWSILLRPNRPLLLITSDPDIADIQSITGQQVSVSNYANHDYIPAPGKVNPWVRSFVAGTLRGNQTAAADVRIAARIGELVGRTQSKLSIRGSRAIQMSDLATDDNLIFLGSPSSNPWSALYADQLDFSFAWDKATGREIIVEKRPTRGGLARYVPTTQGLSAGQSFAIVAFIQNQHQNGQILLLAGTDAEGTEAAGRLVTNTPWLSTTLAQCGINPHGRLRHFEILLRVNTMAGSPSQIQIQACRPLS